MEKNLSRAEIISYNLNNQEICASAARISTTKGNAIEIFEKSKDNLNNQNLIKKVLKSGHQSIIEHAVCTIAFYNVSAYVEQFFIECRLASFTVKSRRYVDFSNLGYYIPSELKGDDLDLYCQYMDHLFSAYHALLEMGVPKEDARFLLPYSFNSNFYCTLNMRELMQIITAIRKGRGHEIAELQNLADQLAVQIENIFPGLLSDLDMASFQCCHAAAKTNDEVKFQDSLSFVEPCEAGEVSLIDEPLNPMKSLKLAYCLNYGVLDKPLDIKRILNSSRPRELEQLSYSFMISNITLSGITHIVRHRIQSIIIPAIQTIDLSKVIIPDTIKANQNCLQFYQNVLKKSFDIGKQIRQNDILRKYSYYFALSGNVMDIMTTINARELKHFIQLRACNRAQWEIRKIAIDMLKLLRRSCPELFQNYGTSCYVNGACPEGNLTCGQIKQVMEAFKHLK